MALTDKLRTNPGDDVLSQLLEGVVLGEPLTPEYVVGEAVILLGGGLDTIRAAASAGGVLPSSNDRTCSPDDRPTLG